MPIAARSQINSCSGPASCDCNSFCDRGRRRLVSSNLPASPPRTRRRLIPALFAGALLLSSQGDAQTLPAADEIFNDAVLHEIRLYVHPRDWASLKSNFQLDDY